MSKIDIHLHVALNRRPLNKEIYVDGANEMKKHLLSLGISKGIVMSSGETEAGNDEVKEISHQHPDFFYWMCNLNFEN